MNSCTQQGMSQMGWLVPHAPVQLTTSYPEPPAITTAMRMLHHLERELHAVIVDY